MKKVKNILENIINNKTKLRIFLGIELIIFTILVSILTINIINRNNVIETAETSNIEIEQNETPEILEENEETEEIAQELTDEEQEKAEKEENIEKSENANSTNSKPSGYGTKYYIKVNYGANVVTVYTQDADGNYTVPIKVMVCSTGVSTPRSGVYPLKSVKHRWGALFGGVWGQYTTQIVGNILFHSVPYLSPNPSNLEYWEYDKLGTAASAGCIRLRVCDAKWIYESMPAGTPVEFYSDSNPGPLGKPSAQKISGNEACRGWDPTDTDANNPWRNVGNEPQQEQIPETQPNNQSTQQQPGKEPNNPPQPEPNTGEGTDNNGNDNPEQKAEETENKDKTDTEEKNKDNQENKDDDKNEEDKKEPNDTGKTEENQGSGDNTIKEDNDK